MAQSPSPTLLFPPFRIPADVDLLYHGEKVVPLEPQAVRVLRYLAQNHERVIPKEELLESVWPNVFTTDGVLKKAISQARRALGDDAEDSRYIATYHGRGYRFIAAVTISNAAQAAPAPPNLPTPVAVPAPQVVAPPVVAIRGETANDPDYDQLVGREAELAVLCAEYRRTLEGTGRPVLIIGEPGIGKTQLARHFQLWARGQGALCLYARFFDYRASRLAPYEIFLDFLRDALGLGPVSLAELRAAIEARWGIVLPEELSSTEGGEATGAAHVRGSTGAFARDNFRAVIPLSKCFTKLSRERPLAMVFDDLQWADSGSRDLIGYLMRTIESEPLMIVGLVRRGGTIDPQHPLAEWMRLQANYRSYTSLTLKPLDENFCRSAIEAIFGGPAFAPDVPPQDLRTLYRMTGGNPYFLIEILRLLVAEEAIARGVGAKARWQWRGMRDLRLPETIVMAAQNKLDRLSPEVRAIAEQAAVLGEEFRVDALARMDGKDEAEIAELLDDGVRRGVLSDRGLLAGEDYRFYHATLRRVLYNNLPPRYRRELHARAARALADLYATEPDRVAGALSNHYEVAGDLEATFTWSMRAWQAARARGNWNESVSSLERAQRALEALDRRGDAAADDTERLTLLIGLGEGYSSVGRMREAETILGEALTLAERLDQKAAKAAVLLQQGQARLGMSLYREANDLTRQALDIYHEVADEEGEVLARIQLGAGEVALGNYAGLAPLVSLLTGKQKGSPVAVIAWGLIGWAHVLQGRYAEGIVALERALEEQERTGDLRQRALIERRIAWAHLSEGRYDRALELAGRARDNLRRVGDLLGEAKTNTELGLMRIAQGLYGEGLELVGRTIDALRIVSDAHCEAEALWALGRAHCEAGRTSQAATLLQRALEMFRVIGDRDDELRALTDLTRLKLAEQDLRAATETANEAVALAIDLEGLDALGLALVERARAHEAQGRLTEGQADAERAVELLDEAGAGERWRGHWALAEILTREPNAPLERPIALLERALAVLAEMRAQIGDYDTERRSAFTRARSGPARTLRDLLNRAGQSAAAAEFAREWLLDEPAG
jgi:DNA-binding winged helix-turn-helix (wHTH) protein/tetratricopeptide (TPR) repeat protein